MKKSSYLITFFLLMLALSCPAADQPPQKTPPRPSSIITLSGAAVEQAKSDFDGGGNYSVSTLLFRLGVTRPVNRTTLVGIGFDYDFADYQFTDPEVFGGNAPWNKVHTMSLSVPIISQYNKRWSFFVSPSLTVAREFDADWQDSLAYGAIFASTYSFSQKRRFGLGLGVFNRIDETRAFPFVSVDWYFTERLRLSNPLRAGPTGPAGLEVAYTVDPKWDIGAGAAYRSFRFRLDNQGIAPGGVGEQRGALAFVRATRSFGPKLNLFLYVGAVLNGELRLENVNNDRLATASHGTAPFFAVSINGRL